MNKKVKALIEAWIYGIILFTIAYLFSEFTGLKKVNIVEGKTISKILSYFNLITLSLILLCGFLVGWLLFYKKKE